MSISSPSRIDRLWQYLATDPGNATLLRDIAHEALATHAHDQALKALNQLAALRVATANDEAAAIHALCSTGQVSEAADRALAARQAWPDDEALRVEAARALMLLRRFEDSLAHSGGTFTDPHLAQMAAELRLRTLWHQGQLDEALALAAEAVRQYPDNPRLAAQHSALLYDQDLAPEAFGEARRAYALSPEHAYSALHVLASECLLHKDIPRALAFVDEAQSVRLDDGRIWLIKGSAHLVSGQLNEAIDELQQATAIFPEQPGALLALAWAHVARGELNAAEATVHQAIEISPAFAESHGTLAVLHAMKGQGEQAANSIRRANLLDKTGFAARFAQSILDGTPAGSVEAIYQDMAHLFKV